jgi:hypothetical protein
MFLTKILYAFLVSSMHALCIMHFILDFVILMFGGEYKLQFPSLYNFFRCLLLLS